MKRTLSTDNNCRCKKVVNIPVGFIGSALVYGSYLCSSVLIDNMAKSIEMNKVAKTIGVSTLITLIGIPTTAAMLNIKDENVSVDMIDVKDKIISPGKFAIKACKQLHQRIHDMYR